MVHMGWARKGCEKPLLVNAQMKRTSAIFWTCEGGCEITNSQNIYEKVDLHEASIADRDKFPYNLPSAKNCASIKLCFAMLSRSKAMLLPGLPDQQTHETFKLASRLTIEEKAE